MTSKPVTRKKLLEIVFEASQCFIPTDELTNEQKDRLDNIRYGLCDCKICKRALTSPITEWKALGHSNRKTYYIGISQDSIEFMAGIGKYGPPSIPRLIIPIFLLQLIKTILHEIIHILSPECNEEEVRDKTNAWLNSFDWSEVR